MKRTILAAAAALFLVASAEQAQAFVGDQWNLNAPGSVSYSASYVQVAARKSDGSIWRKQIDPTVGSWQSIGCIQAGSICGTSSGPVIGTFGVNTYYIARGPYPTDPGNIWERHISNGVWSNWAPTFGQPPTGTLSAPNVASSDVYGLAIVVLDTHFIPWVRTMDTSGDLGGWIQVGTQPVNSVPGIAFDPNSEIYVYGLVGSSNQVSVNACVYEHCFDLGWQPVSNGIGGSGVSAVGYTDPQGNDEIRVTVLGSSGGSTWVSTSVSEGPYSNWTDYNGVSDASPSIVYFWTVHDTIEFTHRSDGNFYSGQDGGWASIGHP
jgi:hypothetical protein